MTDITKIDFGISLKNSEVQAFRGGVLKLFSDNTHPLMHNHTGNGLRFGYPLIQYKLCNGQASILGIGEGSDILLSYIKPGVSYPINIGKEKYQLRTKNILSIQYHPITEDAPKYYKIMDYLPLTESNLQKYNSYIALTDKICLIEKILAANILSFFKGIAYHADEKIECAITSIDNQSIIRYKGVNFKSFDLHFVSNVELPDHIGLGKSTSIGMGVICQEPLPESFLNL